MEEFDYNNAHAKAASDPVNHPSHYNSGKYEVIDVIEDWGLGFCLGNAVKYIARCEHKGNAVQDLEKAVWYLEREIQNREKSKQKAGVSYGQQHCKTRRAR